MFNILPRRESNQTGCAQVIRHQNGALEYTGLVCRLELESGHKSARSLTKTAARPQKSTLSSVCVTFAKPEKELKNRRHSTARHPPHARLAPPAQRSSPVQAAAGCSFNKRWCYPILRDKKTAPCCRLHRCLSHTKERQEQFLFKRWCYAINKNCSRLSFV